MKVCSITPQVTNGTGLVDSKLFDAIKNNLILDDKSFINNLRDESKKEIDSIFKDNIELNSIGDKEEYYKYLSSIFPNSKFKDIVYHYTNKKFDIFDKSYIGSNTNTNKDIPSWDNQFGFFFSKKRDSYLEKELTSNNVMLAIINTTNPGEIYWDERLDTDNETYGPSYIDVINVKNDFINKGFDSSIQHHVIVFEPEQIHVLGSKLDINKFREFTNLKTSIPNKGLELRTKTKQVYTAYKADEFTHIFGEHSLYRRIVGGMANQQEMARFGTVYNNDLESLKKSITLDLDVNGEPLMLSSKGNPVYNTSDKSLLNGNRIISFDDIQDIEDMASRLNTTKDILIDNILSNNNIYFLDNGNYIASSLLEDSNANEEFTLGSKFNLQVNNPLDTLKLDDSSISDSVDNIDVRNIDDLSLGYSNSEITELGKIVGSLLTINLEEFREMLKTLSDKGTYNYDQNLKIKKFINTKITKYKDSIIKEYIALKDSTTDTVEQQRLISQGQQIAESFKQLIDIINYESDNGEFSFVYRGILAIVSKEYNIDIAYKNNIAEIIDQDVDGNDIVMEVNAASWDGRGALNTMQQYNIDKELKLLLTTSMNNHNADVHNNKNVNSKYGVSTPITVSDVWNVMMNVSSNTGDRQTIIKYLRDVNHYEFNGALTEFIDKISVDDNLWNSYYTGAIKAMWNITQTRVKSSNDNTRTVISTNSINYMSNPIAVAKESILSHLTLNTDNSNNKAELALLGNYQSKDGNIDLISKFNSKEDASNVMKYIVSKYSANKQTYVDNLRTIIKNQLITTQLNKVMSINDIDRYIALTTEGNPFSAGDVIFDVQGDKTFASLNPSHPFKVNAIKAYTEVLTSLIRLNIDSQKVRLNPKNNRTSYRNLYDERTSVDNLAKVISIKQYRNTSLGYFNENGDMEQTPQKPSFLSDFAKVFKSMGNNLNEDLLKSYFKGYLSDASMQYNTFLYNIHNSDGIFNITKNPNGTIEHTVNPNFIKNFSAEMYSGIMYSDTGMGMKYDEITGDSWTIIKIQQALQSVWGAPSSDTGRHYTISTKKYGLKSLAFDDAGKYNPLLGIIKELGLEGDINYLPNTKSIPTRKIDLNDPNFKVAVPNGLNKFKIMTIGELKDVSQTTTIFATALSNSLNTRIMLFNSELNTLKRKLKDGKKQFEGNTNYEFIKNYDGKPTNVGEAYIKQFGNVALQSALNGTKNLSIEELQSAIVNIYHLINPTNPTNFRDLIFDKSHTLDDEAQKRELFDQFRTFDQYGNADFKNMQVIVNELEVKNKYATDKNSILDIDKMLLDKYSEFRESALMQTLKNTIETERFVMTSMIDQMFDFEYQDIVSEVDESKVLKIASKISLKEGIQDLANKGQLSAPMLHNGKSILSPSQSQGRNISTPTGKAFQFNRMTYTVKNENGTNDLVTLQSFIASKIFNGKGTIQDVLELVARTSVETNPKKNILSPVALKSDTQFAINLFNKYTYEFMDNWIASKQDKSIEAAKPFIDELHSTVIDNIPAYVDGTSNVTTRRRTANIFSMADEVATIVDKETLAKSKEQGISSLEARYSAEAISRAANKGLLEAVINDYIKHMTIGEDILFGRSYEYKGIKDINKRVNEIIKNGNSNESSHQIRSITITDPETISNMLDKLKSNNGISEEFLKEQYSKEVEVGNGLSMITVDEYIARLKANNDYEKYKPYIDALTDPTKQFNPGDYTYITEQLKYYMYNRKVSENGITKGLMTSYQEKNSTIVLFPKVFDGTTYEGIINWMNERRVGELNFLSASKVGGQPVLKMHDIHQTEVLGQMRDTHYSVPIVNRNGINYFDDRIDKTIDNFEDNNRIVVDDYVVTHELKNLRIQQDTVGHLEDEHGALASQQVKKVFTNMNDNESYTIGGKTYLGRSYNYEEGKRGLFETFHLVLSTNAEQSMMELISHWGGLDANGDINYNAQGVIDLDESIIEKDIAEYFATSADVATMRALDVKGDNKFSLHNPSIRNKVEELLQSKITKNAAIQLRQIHAPIMPDVFMQPISHQYSKDSILKDQDISNLYNNGTITLDSSFLKRKGTDAFELQSEYYEINDKGEQILHPAEIIANPWDKQFDEYRTTKVVNAPDSEFYNPAKPTYTVAYVDIDKIPEASREMVGTRIPHEGMQSSFLARVVGFMNTDASQIIVPKHLSKRTGWDYDIDTVYLFPKNLYKVNGLLQPISYENDLKQDSTLHNTIALQKENVLRTYFAKDYGVIKNQKDFQIRKAVGEYRNSIQNANKTLGSKYNTLNQQIQKINATTLTEDEKLIKAIELVKEALNVTNVYTPNIAAISNMIRMDRESLIANNKEILSAIDDAMVDILDSTSDTTKNEIDSIVNKLSEIQTNTKAKYEFITADNSAELNRIKSEGLTTLKESIKSIKSEFESKYNELVNSDTFNNKFNSLSPIQKLSKETRDNMLVDVIAARISSKDSAEFREQPNEYVDSANSANWVNKIYGIDDTNSNFGDMFDRASIENMNRDVRKLKGVSVSLDNNYAVLGSIGASVVSKMAIPYVVERSEFTHATDTEIRDSLQSTIGLENCIIYNTSGAISNNNTDEISKVVIFANTLGNNTAKNWTNVNGTRISKFASQITANVLDAVKDNLGFNINVNTIGILTMLANIPVSHNTDIFSKDGKRKDTAFIYSNLILHQAIVSKVLSEMNKSSRGGEFSDKNNAIKTVKNDVYIKLISTIHNIEIAKSIDGTKVSPLDLYHRYLRSIVQQSKVVTTDSIKYDTIGKWIESINKGNEIEFHSNSMLNHIDLFNEAMKFMSGKLHTENNVDVTLDNYMQQYLFEAEYANKSNNTEFNLPQAFTKGVFTHSAKKGYTIINENAFKTITELANNYKNSIKDNNYNIDAKYENLKSIDDSNAHINFLNFLTDQLSMLDLYEHIDSTAGLISKASSPLSVDKKGTSPNGEVTSKLTNNMIDMHLDLNAFLENMKEVGYPKEEISRFKKEYYKRSTLYAKEAYMDYEILVFSGLTDDEKKLFGDNKFNKTLDKHKVGLRVGEKTLIESIFPNFVDGTLNKGFDVTKSSYPFFEAQYNYLNNFSTKAFGTVLLSENENIKPLVDSIMSSLNLSTNMGDRKRSKYRNKIINTLINRHIIANMPFFNGGYGIDNIRTSEDLAIEIRRVLGNPKEYLSTETINGEEVKVPTIADDVYTTVNDFEHFKTLSAANKVVIIKGFLQQGVIKNVDNRTKSDIQRLLSYVEPRITKNDIKQYGYHSIKVNSTEENVNQLKQTFTKMYFSENAFIREMTRDLIKYSFHTSSLQYGANISKWMEPSLLHENNSFLYNQSEELKQELLLPQNQLWKYNEIIKGVANSYVDYDIDSILKDFRAQMYNDNSITPLAYARKGINQPQFNESMKFAVDGDIVKNYPIIIESKSKLNNSKYSDNQSLRLKLNVKDYNNTFAMMRYEPEGSTNVYFYPFKRQLSNVFTEDVLNLHSQNLLSSEVYESIIDAYDVAHTEQEDVRSITDIYPTDEIVVSDAKITGSSTNYQYYNKLTTSNKSYSETAKDIISSVDHVFVIGDNSHYINSFKSDKTTNVSLDKFNHKTFENILFNKPTTIAIVGDTLSDNKLSQNDYDKIIMPTLAYITENYNISGIKTIFKKGVGESIYKATFRQNIDKEYIKVGIKDEIQDIRSIDDALISPFVVTSTKETFDTIAKLKSNFATNARLKQLVRNFENSHADTFDFNLQSVRDTISKINDEDNTFKGITEALNKNFEAVDKVIEFFNAEGMDILIDGKLERINMLHSDFNIYKYLNGRDTDFKVRIAKRLNLYQNVIHVANEVMKLQTITPPPIDSAEFKTLSEENQNYIINQRQQIDLYNNTLLKYKSSMYMMPYSGETKVYPVETELEKKGLTREGKIDILNQRIISKIEQFHGANLMIHTRNPKYKNSTFTKLVNKIVSGELVLDNTVDPSAEDLVKIYAQAIKYNDDLKFVQLNVDSVRNTGIAIIDCSFKLFEEFKINADAKKQLSINKLNNLFEMIGIKRDSFDYDETRMKMFKDKFINRKTGELITKYDNITYNRDLKNHKYNSDRMSGLYNILNSRAILQKTDILVNLSNGNKESIETSKINIPTKILNIYQNIVNSKSNFKDFYNNGNIVNGVSTINIMSTTLNDKDITIKVVLKNNHTLLKDANGTPNFFKDILITDGIETFSYSDLQNNTFSAIADNRLQFDRNTNYLGYLNKIPISSPEYDKYLNDYIFHNLSDNTAKRKAYEKKYGIQFKDTIGVTHSSEKEYTTKLQELEYEVLGKDTTIKKSDNILDRRLSIAHVIPDDKYLNEKYTKLTDNEKVFISKIRDTMQEIMDDVTPNKILAEDTIPYIFLSSTKGLGRSLLDLVGYQAVQEEHVEKDVLGNVKHQFKINSLQKPNIKNLVPTSPKTQDETHYEYEERIVKAANEKLVILKKYNPSIIATEFSTYRDVINYNDAVMDEYLAKAYDSINHDLPSVMHHFVEEMYHIKGKMDFENVYSILLNTVGSESFEARAVRASGDNLRDKTYNIITGENTYVSKKGTETAAFKRLQAFEPLLTDQSRITTVADQMVKMSLKYVSLNTMGANWHTWVKNVYQGISSNVIAAAGGNLMNKKEYGRAMNTYMSSISSMIAGIGKTTTNNETVAILKYFEGIYMDHTEGALTTQTGGKFSKASNVVDTMIYSGVIIGEHSIQMTTLLALMDSHRLVPVTIDGKEQGIIMSRGEYINNRKAKVIKPLLTSEQLTSFEEYEKSQAQYDSNMYAHRDIFGYWVRYKSNLTSEQKQSIIKDLAIEKDKAIVEFEGKKDVTGKLRIGGFPNIKSLITLDKDEFVKDDKGNLVVDDKGVNIRNHNFGKAKLDERLSTQQLAIFSDRVRAFNQSLNGVYNTLDRSKLQNSIVWEVAFQFRKFIYPLWIRYMGSNFTMDIRKHDRTSQFDESLGIYKEGIFQTFFNFLKTPYIKAMLEAKDAHLKYPSVVAFATMFRSFGNSVENIKLEYAMLSEQQKGNVRSALQFMLNLAVISMVLFVAGGGFDKDKDKKKFGKIQSWWINDFAGLQTEYMDVIPFYGWATFYSRAKQHPFPLEKTIGDLSKLMYDMGMYSFRTPEGRVYKSGVYAGESKIEIGLEKSIPIYRQFHKEKYMQQNINFYKQYNQAFNIMSDIK